ncbi:hypothetical protein U1Q18_003561, partial [Sarracenia purpurea var. burkii]
LNRDSGTSSIVRPPSFSSDIEVGFTQSAGDKSLDGGKLSEAKNSPSPFDDLNGVEHEGNGFEMDTCVLRADEGNRLLMVGKTWQSEKAGTKVKGPWPRCEPVESPQEGSQIKGDARLSPEKNVGDISQVEDMANSPRGKITIVEPCGEIPQVPEEENPDANNREATELVSPPVELLAVCPVTMEGDSLEGSDLDSPPHNPSLDLHTRVHIPANRTIAAVNIVLLESSRFGTDFGVDFWLPSEFLTLGGVHCFVVNGFLRPAFLV